jgi:hypothetical protein
MINQWIWHWSVISDCKVGFISDDGRLSVEQLCQIIVFCDSQNITIQSVLGLNLLDNYQVYFGNDKMSMILERCSSNIITLDYQILIIDNVLATTCYFLSFADLLIFLKFVLTICVFFKILFKLMMIVWVFDSKVTFHFF